MATVLVVEDEAPILIMAESILQCAGYEMLSAANVDAARAIIQSDQNVDLVFTDITLNNHPKGGVTIGKIVEQSRQGVPVLYTSGRPTDGMRSMFASKSKFLPKPYTEQQLRAAIASLLAWKDC